MNNTHNYNRVYANDLGYTKGELTGIISSSSVDSYNTSMSDEALEEIVSQGVGKLVSFEHTNDTSSMIGKVKEVTLLPDKRVKFRASISKPYHRVMNELFHSGLDFGFSVGNLTDKFKTTLVDGKKIVTSLNGFDHFAVTLSPANPDTLNTGSFRSFINSGDTMTNNLLDNNVINPADLNPVTQKELNEFKEAVNKIVNDKITNMTNSFNASLANVSDEVKKVNEVSVKANEDLVKEIKELNDKFSTLDISKDNSDVNIDNSTNSTQSTSMDNTDVGIDINNKNNMNNEASAVAGEGRSQAPWQQGLRQYKPPVSGTGNVSFKSRRDADGNRIF